MPDALFSETRQPLGEVFGIGMEYGVAALAVCEEEMFDVAPITQPNGMFSTGPPAIGTVFPS